MTDEALVYDAIRTPRGRGKVSGSLHTVRPVALLVGLLDELRKRNPELDTAAIEDVVLGVVSPLGDQGGCIARTAALAAGLPHTVTGLQINRLCGSGLESVNIATSKVKSCSEQLVIAGGVESMSRIPMSSDGGAMMNDLAVAYDSYFVGQGTGADLIATMEGFTRDMVDAYAVRSQQRAKSAWDSGFFGNSVIPVVDQNGVTLLDHDEHMRPSSTVEGLAGLPPSFAAIGAAGFDAVALQKYHWLGEIDHVHTAANSSGIVDGAALVLIGNEAVGEKFGLIPRARVIASATSGADNTIMLTGPTPATQKLLTQVGLTVDDIDLFEINEAFAAVVLKYQKDMNIPDEKLNVNGGAIAMGHPLGATGAMILGTVIDELERRGGRRALITLCIGGGMGIATLVERV